MVLEGVPDLVGVVVQGVGGRTHVGRLAGLHRLQNPFIEVHAIGLRPLGGVEYPCLLP